MASHVTSIVSGAWQLAVFKLWPFCGQYLCASSYIARVKVAWCHLASFAACVKSGLLWWEACALVLCMYTEAINCQWYVVWVKVLNFYIKFSLSLCDICGVTKDRCTLLNAPLIWIKCWLVCKMDVRLCTCSYHQFSNAWWGLTEGMVADPHFQCFTSAIRTETFAS